MVSRHQCVWGEGNSLGQLLSLRVWCASVSACRCAELSLPPPASQPPRTSEQGEVRGTGHCADRTRVEPENCACTLLTRGPPQQRSLLEGSALRKRKATRKKTFRTLKHMTHYCVTRHPVSFHAPPLALIARARGAKNMLLVCTDVRGRVVVTQAGG